MENPIDQPHTDPLEDARKVAKNARESINAELLKALNQTWLECFSSVATALGNYLSIAKKKNLVDEREYSLWESRFEGVLSKIRQYKQEYDAERKVMPEELKEELLADIDIFREE